MTTLLSLPEEILHHIISFLPVKDVLQLILVCKFFNKFISNSNLALENVPIYLNDNKNDSFYVFSRKYSNIHFELKSAEKIIRNVDMICNIGHQMRVLQIIADESFKLSHLQKILNKCHYLKELLIKDNGMEIDEIDDQLPTTKIDKLIFSGNSKVLDILCDCSVRFFKCQQIEDEVHLKSFFDHQQLDGIEMTGLMSSLALLPGDLRVLSLELKSNLYNFKGFVDSQTLEIFNAFGRYINADHMNQLGKIKTLKNLNLKVNSVKNYETLEVMEFIQNLSLKVNVARRFEGIFPNLKHLKLINHERASFLSFFESTLRMIIGDIEVDIQKLCFGLNEINFEQILFIIKQQNLDTIMDSSATAMIEKVFYWKDEIEVKAFVVTERKILDMKIVMKKAENLCLQTRKKAPTLSDLVSKVLLKIALHLSYEENLTLRLVGKKLNDTISNSPNFISRTQFELNKESHDIFLDKNFPSFVLKEFAAIPDFTWCTNFFKNNSENMQNLIFHVGNDVPLMVLRNLINLCENVKNITILENESAKPFKKGIVGNSSELKLKLNSLKIQGNLRVLNLFSKTEIDSLTIESPKNSFELFDFLNSHDSILKDLTISNQDLHENFEILLSLGSIFKFTNKFDDDIQDVPFIEFIHLNFEDIHVKKLVLKNAKKLSILNEMCYIEDLCLIDCCIDLTKSLPCVSKLTLKSCKIIEKDDPHSIERQIKLKLCDKLSDEVTERFVKYLKKLNQNLEKIEIDDLVVALYWIKFFKRL